MFAVAADEAVVVGMRVNLRAAPDATSEIIGQVLHGDRLVLTGKTEGDWLQVAVPDAVSVWVYGPLVKDGVAHVSRLQVRAGPGINYRMLGAVEKGRRLAIRNVQFDWIEIAPPDGCRAWISSAYAEPVESAAVVPDSPAPASSPASAVVPPPDTRVARFPTSTPPARLPPVPKPPMPADDAQPLGRVAVAERHSVKTAAFPNDLTTAPGMPQGRQAVYTGRLRRTGSIWRRPANYRLVGEDEKGRAVTVCYLLDAGRNLDAMLGREMVASGAEYWVQGFRLPTLQADKIVLKE